MPRQTIKEKRTTAKATATKRHNLHNVHEANGFIPHFGQRRTKRKEFSINDLNPSVALGVIAMGLASAATFLLINSKKQTRSLRGNFYQKYQHIKDEAGDYAHDAYQKGKNAYNSAADYAESIKDAAHDAMDQPYSGSLLLAGAIGGTLLGASSIYLLNRFNTADNSHEFLNRVTDVFGTVKNAAKSFSGKRKSANWLDSAKQFMESIQENVSHLHEEIEDEEEHPHHRSHHNSSSLHDIIHLGVMGIRLWDRLKKG